MIVPCTDTDKKDKKIVGLTIPTIIFGTSGLGNLFVALDDKAKLEILKECIHRSKWNCCFRLSRKVWRRSCTCNAEQMPKGIRSEW